MARPRKKYVHLVKASVRGSLSIFDQCLLEITGPNNVRLPSERPSSIMPSSKRDRDRSRSPERDVSLPEGVSPISESDYFLKNTEFRVWLKDEKDKVCLAGASILLDTLSLER